MLHLLKCIVTDLSHAAYRHVHICCICLTNINIFDNTIIITKKNVVALHAFN